jgi:hypothetical protein
MKIDKRAAPTARRIHKRGLMKKVHLLSTHKSDGIMQIEGRHEANGARALALDPRVHYFRPQPMTIELNSGRIYKTKEALHEAFRGSGVKPKAYTPDFEVHLASKSVFLETKPSGLIRKHPNVLEFPKIFRAFGLELIIIDESGFPEPYCENLKLLLLAVRHRPDDDAVSRMVDVAHDPIAFGDLLTRARVDQEDLLAAIAQGKITCDITSDILRHETLVSSRAPADAHLRRLPL